MRVLLIKTSSLGDLIHLMPAITEAKLARPPLQFDWAVERAFSALPQLHPAVEHVVPVALRQWRHALFQYSTWTDIHSALSELRRSYYDYVIDAQGLLKSAMLCCLARSASSWGYDYASARECSASFFYQQRVKADWSLHAIERCRQLLSRALQYKTSNSPPSYGLLHDVSAQVTSSDAPYVLGLHGTSREHKEWPEENWNGLAGVLQQRGLQLVLPWGSERERLRAERIRHFGSTRVLPALGYQALTQVIRGASAVVGVDTGLLHLAAALGKGIIALYPSTDPASTGAVADRDSSLPVVNLTGADSLTVDAVSAALDTMLASAHESLVNSTSRQGLTVQSST